MYVMAFGKPSAHTNVRSDGDEDNADVNAKVSGSLQMLGLGGGSLSSSLPCQCEP